MRGWGGDVGQENSRSSGPLELDSRWKEGVLRQMLFAQRLYLHSMLGKERHLWHGREIWPLKLNCLY